MKSNSQAMRLTLIPACALALALAGCSPKPTIVGKWQGTSSGQGGPANLTFEFTQDGKETVNFQSTGGPVSMSMGGSGTYTVNGSSLTQNITTLTIGGRSMALPAAQAQAKTSAFTLDGDRLTLTAPTSQQTMTLTRVKE